MELRKLTEEPLISVTDDLCSKLHWEQRFRKDNTAQNRDSLIYEIKEEDALWNNLYNTYRLYYPI